MAKAFLLVFTSCKIEVVQDYLEYNHCEIKDLSLTSYFLRGILNCYTIVSICHCLFNVECFPFLIFIQWNFRQQHLELKQMKLVNLIWHCTNLRIPHRRNKQSEVTKWRHKCLEIKDVDTGIPFDNAIPCTPATKEYIYLLASITISHRQISLLYW